MKKIIKLLVLLIVLSAITAAAALGIMALWNNIATEVCGFAAINFCQAVGLFILGQLLSGGFIIALFVGIGSLHHVFHSRRSWHDHWHNMTDEERLQFIQRRRERFGFGNRPGNLQDGSNE